MPVTYSLPDVVNFTVTYDGIENYFDLTIHDTFLADIYEAWCVDKYTPLPDGDYSANVYSIYETIPPSLIGRLDTLDSVNWLINQDNIIDNPNYSIAEIQDAIWLMVEPGYTSPFSDSNFIASEALSKGDGFIPGHDEDIAIVLAPLPEGEAQTIIIPTPVSADIYIEKLTNDEDADTLANAVLIAPGEPLKWTYQVTNTGNVPYRIDAITVTDDREGEPTLVLDNAAADGLLTPGETIRYENIASNGAEDLSLIIDFETDAAGNPLAAGTVIDTEYQDIGVKISAPGHDHGAMIFDTANVTGGDDDLLDPNLKTGKDLLGNVLILSQNGNRANPNDDAGGGTFRFEFDDLLGISRVNLLDIDTSEKVIIRTFDTQGILLESQVFEGAGDNKLQTAEINSGLIAALEVELTGSGAITGLEGDRFYVNTAIATVAGFPDIQAVDISHYVNSVFGPIKG